MTHLQEENPDRYERQFSKSIKNKISAETLAGIYKSAHAAIRKNPDRAAKPARKHAPVRTRQGNNIKTSKTTFSRPVKLTNKQRKERVAQKIQIAQKRALAAADE